MVRLIVMSLVKFLDIIELALVIRAVLSFIPSMKDNQFTRIMYQITEPILAPIRKVLEKSSFGRGMMVDISPIIAFLLAEVIKYVLQIL